MLFYHYINIDAEIVLGTIQSGELDELESLVSFIIKQEFSAEEGFSDFHSTKAKHGQNRKKH